MLIAVVTRFVIVLRVGGETYYKDMSDILRPSRKKKPLEKRTLQDEVYIGMIEDAW